MNPFDQFESDFRSAIPTTGNPADGGNAHVFQNNAVGQTTQPPIAQMNSQPVATVPPPHFAGNQATGIIGVGVPDGTVLTAPVPPMPPPQQGVANPGAGMYYGQTMPTQSPNQPATSSALVATVDGPGLNPYTSALGVKPDQLGPQQVVGTQHQFGGTLKTGSNLQSSDPSGSMPGANPFQPAPSPGVPPMPSGGAAPFEVGNPFGAPTTGPAGSFQGTPVSAPTNFEEINPASALMQPQVGSGVNGHFDPISSVSQGPPTDPYGAPQVSQNNALVPSSAPGDDPFGVFAAPAAPPATSTALTPTMAPNTSTAPQMDDPWSDMGFGSSRPSAVNQLEIDNTQGGSKTMARGPGELPPGGEWYDARIFTPTLGVMFFKPQELTDSLFLQTDKSLVDTLDDRPVVAFIVEGSSARSAGVELGHVLLKVNGIDVKNPKEASRLIKEGPRPLPLLFYVPDTTVVVAEGEHMVKYDTRETGAPNSAKDWKPKYVVIGGIIAQPWMMNMYRSKVCSLSTFRTSDGLLPTSFHSILIFVSSVFFFIFQSEYDIAVIETQARRPVSVKVKQFSLQGARIQNDWQGPQMVKYKNKLHPWKYIVVLPVSRNPIKVSSPNLSQLKPVHEGIRRVIMAQQRDRGQPGPHTAAPIRQADPYARNGHAAAPPRDDYRAGGSGSAQYDYTGDYRSGGGAGSEAGGVGTRRRNQEF